jgi:hypothetical protein
MGGKTNSSKTLQSKNPAEVHIATFLGRGKTRVKQFHFN